MRTTLWIPLVVAIAGCAGTPWGERLSSSFPPSEGPQPPRGQEFRPKEEPSPGPQSQPPVPSGAPMAPPAPPTSPTPGTKAPPPAAAPAKPRAAAETRPPVPSPYRVTIRLPQADPAAPAEGVTQALRGAGIPFEVETIERVKGADAPPGPAAAPTIRPAPPPR